MFSFLFVTLNSKPLNYLLQRIHWNPKPPQNNKWHLFFVNWIYDAHADKSRLDVKITLSDKWLSISSLDLFLVWNQCKVSVNLTELLKYYDNNTIFFFKLITAPTKKYTATVASVFPHIKHQYHQICHVLVRSQHTCLTYIQSTNFTK